MQQQYWILENCNSNSNSNIKKLSDLYPCEGLYSVRSKADDPWVSKQMIREKVDDLRAEAGDPGLKQRALVRADDLSVAKQTIFEPKQTIRDESRRSQGDEIGRSHIISKVTDLWDKADDPNG